MRRRRRDLRPAGQILDRALRRTSGGPDPTLGPVREAWVTAAGGPVAEAAMPVRRTRAGVLTIACADASWAAELRARSDELLGRLDDALPRAAEPISGLRFVVSERPPDDRPTAARRVRPRRPTEAERERAQTLVEGVSDPQLRDVLARAAATTLAGERKRRKTPGK